jgi:hypothetical protein
MVNLIRIFVLACVMLWASGAAEACREMTNPIIFSEGGTACYALSRSPHLFKNGQGKTDIHLLKDGRDEIVKSFNWYSRNIFLKCAENGDYSLVRLADTRRAHLQQADYPAIEFYRNGNLVKAYSARELAKEKETHVSSECGDLFLFGMQPAYDSASQKYRVSVKLGNRTVVFDAVTGDIIDVDRSKRGFPQSSPTPVE